MGDWITITRKSRSVKPEQVLQVEQVQQVQQVQQTHKYTNERMYKLDKSDTPGPKKYINPKSLQDLIRTRINKNLNQEKADCLCAFPRNTFKNIESNRIIPTEEQKRRIQQHFDTYLKTDIMND